MATMAEHAMLFANKWCSTMVAGTAFVAVAVYRNEWTISLVGGAVVNAGIGKALKRFLKVSRPDTSQRFSHGMPSSHANSLFFYAAALSCRAITAHASSSSSSSSSSSWHVAAQVILLNGYASMISYSRVYLTKDHTPAQILGGAVLGISCGLMLECFRPLYIE